MRLVAASWSASVLLHVLAPLIALTITMGGDIALVFSGEDLSKVDLSGMMPPEVIVGEPETIDISPNKVVTDHGGKDEAQRADFKEFAESGGLADGGGKPWEFGPKVRFGHSVVKYFSYYRSSFVGHYQTRAGMDVYVMDGRNDPRFKALLLHVPSENFTRCLKSSGSRYIYSYGPGIKTYDPVEGTVMFMGDGDAIYRFLWMPAQGRAMYPEKVMYKR